MANYLNYINYCPFPSFISVCKVTNNFFPFPKIAKKLLLFNFRLRDILTLRAIDAPCADEAGFSGTKRPLMSALLTKYNRLKDSQLDNEKPTSELLDTEVVTWKG